MFATSALLKTCAAPRSAATSFRQSLAGFGARLRAMMTSRDVADVPKSQRGGRRISDRERLVTCWDGSPRHVIRNHVGEWL